MTTSGGSSSRLGSRRTNTSAKDSGEPTSLDGVSGLMPSLQRIRCIDERRNMREEITVTEACKILGCSYWTFRRQIHPRLESRKLYGKTGPFLYQKNQVERLKTD